jgi:MoxR-like ATPase
MPALFDVAEYGKIQTSAGPVPIPRGILMLNDFNTEDRKTVQKLSAAGQSRSDILVSLDYEDEKFDATDLKSLINDNTTNPALAQTIVNDAELERWQAGIDRLDLSDDGPNSIADYVVSLVKSTKRLLKIEKYDVLEGLRMYRQVGRLTKIRGLAEGKYEAEGKHAEDALSFVAPTRLGGIAPEDGKEFGKFVDELTKEAIRKAY